MPRPSRSTFTMPRSAQSSLSHCTTTRPCIVAGSSGTTESRAPWQMTMPPEWWDRCRGRSCNRTHRSRYFAIRFCVRSSPAVVKCQSNVSFGPLHSKLPTIADRAVQGFRIEPKYLADLASGQPPVRAHAVNGPVFGPFTWKGSIRNMTWPPQARRHKSLSVK